MSLPGFEMIRQSMTPQVNTENIGWSWHWTGWTMLLQGLHYPFSWNALSVFIQNRNEVSSGTSLSIGIGYFVTTLVWITPEMAVVLGSSVFIKTTHTLCTLQLNYTIFQLLLTEVQQCRIFCSYCYSIQVMDKNAVQRL